MKRCPECGREYDNTMMFCLDDGAELLYGPARSEPGSVATGFPSDEPQTAILHSTAAPGEAPTRAQIHTTEQTAVLPSGITEVPKTNGFDKRLLFAPVALAVIVLGGFFGYRYVTQAKQIESIAVMPFVNESGNPDVEYLSDGMTETLIGSLSNLPNLSVKPRSTVFRYKGKEADTRAIGSDLNVQAILNGRVSQRGDQLTLNLELVDVERDIVLWSRQYNRSQADLVTLQSEIARDLSRRLKSALSGVDSAKVERNYTANAEAYQLYLKGRFYWIKRTSTDIKRSIDYFDQAIALDPAYALAYAGLADAWQVLPSYTNDPLPEIAYPKARAAALKALEIDPNMAEPHAALGVILHEFDWKHAEAEREFKRAIELDPNYASGRQWYGEFLRNMGRVDEAHAQMKTAQELEPLSLIMNAQLAITYACLGRHDDAISQYLKTLELDPTFQVPIRNLPNVYAAKGMYEEVIVYERKIGLADGVSSDRMEKFTAELTTAYRKDGPRGYWQKYLDLSQKRENSGGFTSLMFTAQIHTNLGDQDEALDLLEEQFEKDRYNKGLLRLKGNPVWAPLRTEPRFQAILRRLGLPE